MKYAHIFRVDGRFQLLGTSTPSLTGATELGIFDDKKSARAAAEALGLKAWNY